MRNIRFEKKRFHLLLDFVPQFRRTCFQFLQEKRLTWLGIFFVRLDRTNVFLVPEPKQFVRFDDLPKANVQIVQTRGERLFRNDLKALGIEAFGRDENERTNFAKIGVRRKRWIAIDRYARFQDDFHRSRLNDVDEMHLQLVHKCHRFA